MDLEQALIDQIRTEHANAPRGAKTAVVEKFAALRGCSVKKIWREIKSGRKRRKETGKTQPLQDVTETVFKVKYRGPDGIPPLSSDQAYDLALKNNLIPEGTRRYSISSINRKGKELELNKETRRVQRFQAERPNQMHHVDASTSNFFYAFKKLEDGDYMLKLHGSSQGYKNKPTPLHQRVWIYGITDDHSGCCAARYTVAPGESLADNLQFLEWAWSQTDDKIFCGLPDKIKADKGPMMRGKATEDLFHRIGVEIDPSVPGAKDAHGKIERPWRTHFQRFERQFLTVDDWKKSTITLSELNIQFSIYLSREYNQRRHRYEKDITREQAWKKIQLCGGIRPLPKGAFASAFRTFRRKVHKDGTLSLGNELYEVKGLHDAWVNVLVSVFTGEMVAQEIKTGEKHDIIPFKPNTLDHFTAHKDTPYQKTRKGGECLQVTGSLFEEDDQAKNIVHMPIRMQNEQQIEAIFNTDSYPSIQEAISDFMVKSGQFPEAGTKEMVNLEKIIAEKNLSKSFVKKLASDFLQTKNSGNRRYSHG